MANGLPRNLRWIVAIGLIAPSVAALSVSGQQSGPDPDPPPWPRTPESLEGLRELLVESAKLPGLIEGYITRIKALPPQLAPVPLAGGEVFTPLFPEDEGSLVAGRVVTLERVSFRCRPGGYLVDVREYQVTREGPQAPLVRETYWASGDEGEWRFIPREGKESSTPGDAGPTGSSAVGIIEDPLQVDIGLGEGPTRYWLRRKTEAPSLRVRDGVMRQGLSCIEIAYKRSQPTAQEVVEWVCPDRGYRCVERVVRSHPLNGHVKYLHMVVESFAEVSGGLWLPATSSMTTTDVAPDGATLVWHESIICSGVRLVEPVDAALTPLLANGTIMAQDGRVGVAGDNTKDLEAQLAAGQLPPPLPVPDLEGVWP